MSDKPSKPVLPRARVALVAIVSVALLTVSAAPFRQWYLAWVALAPWLVIIGEAPTIRSAAWRGWSTGVLYFGANIWWLWTASIPGTALIVLIFALYWAVAAVVIRGLRLVATREHPDGQKRALYDVFAAASVWVAAEWLRCYLGCGFPWLPLGVTQSPLPVMCQVADLGGPWIVTFWLMLVNALLATAWLERRSPLCWRMAAATVTSVLIAVAAYGVWRIRSTATSAGPVIMLVQSNFPHLPGGAPTVGREEAVDFLIGKLEKQLAEERADLAVLPESAFPPINDEARHELNRSPAGPFLEQTYQRLIKVANDHHTALLVGGDAVTGWATHGGEHIGSEIRNSAYFFDPQAKEQLTRYDKIHLVRFSERLPLASGPEWLRHFATFVAAARAIQPMHAGRMEDLRPFQVNWGDTSRARFISPICLENIDPEIVRQMVRGDSASNKQADFIANISNDGWFATQERYQHLQISVFRCIENRLAMVRSSNTGVSAFVDSTGRVRDFIAADKAGAAVMRIGLDDRRTFYTRYGDVFPVTCVGFAAAALVVQLMKRIGQKRAPTG